MWAPHAPHLASEGFVGWDVVWCGVDVVWCGCGCGSAYRARGMDCDPGQLEDVQKLVWFIAGTGVLFDVVPWSDLRRVLVDMFKQVLCGIVQGKGLQAG